MIEGQDTYQLLPRAFVRRSGLVRDIFLFDFLCSMEPPADTQTFSTILCTNDDFLHGMETLTRLNLEEYELIPAGRYALDRDRIGTE